MTGRYKRHIPSFPSSRLKRPRPSSQPLAITAGAETANSGKQSFLVMVSGIPSDCQVLELKSRLQIYGAISRLHLEPHLCRGYVTFRSKESAEAAIAAAADSTSGISIGSAKVRVSWPNDILFNWSTGVQISSGRVSQPSSKLLRAEVPLSKHGRACKNLHSTIDISPRATRNEPGMPRKGREIVAYDDLL